MRNGYKAMDSDMHVMEPCDLWQKYIDKKFLDRAPVGLNRHKRDLGVQVEGKIMPRPTPKPNPELKPIRERILSEKYADEEARDLTMLLSFSPWTRKVSTWRFSIQAAVCSCSPSTDSIRISPQ